MDQFFAHVGLSDHKEKVNFVKTKVAGRALEYWNNYANLHFNSKWVSITWKEMKDNLRIICFRQYHQKIYLPSSHGNFLHQRDNIRHWNKPLSVSPIPRPKPTLVKSIFKDIQEDIKDFSVKTKLFASLYQKKIHSSETKVSHLEDNDMGNKILEMKEPQAPLEPSAENKLQVPTDEPKLCMEDLTEHVADSLLVDEETAQQKPRV